MKTRIYQIIPELDIHHIKFMGFADMRQHYGGIVPAEIYGCVYDGTLQTQDLEEIFKLFNTERPTGYKGHSLSVSDVVEQEDDCGNCPLFLLRCVWIPRGALSKRTSRIDLIWQHRSQKGAK